MYIRFDLSIPKPHIYPPDKHAQTRNPVCVKALSAALIVITKAGNNTKAYQIGQQIKKE